MVGRRFARPTLQKFTTSSCNKALRVQLEIYSLLPFSAFSLATVARVSSAFFIALDLHPAQQTKTGCPFTSSFSGAPIEPRGVVVITAQNFCASASLRSAGLSFSNAIVTSDSPSSPCSWSACHDRHFRRELLFQGVTAKCPTGSLTPTSQELPCRKTTSRKRSSLISIHRLTQSNRLPVRTRTDQVDVHQFQCEHSLCQKSARQRQRH